DSKPRTFKELKKYLMDFNKITTNWSDRAPTYHKIIQVQEHFYGFVIQNVDDKHDHVNEVIYESRGLDLYNRFRLELIDSKYVAGKWSDKNADLSELRHHLVAEKIIDEDDEPVFLKGEQFKYMNKE